MIIIAHDAVNLVCETKRTTAKKQYHIFGVEQNDAKIC